MFRKPSKLYQHEYFLYNSTETDREWELKKTCYHHTFVRGKLSYVLHIVLASYRWNEMQIAVQDDWKRAEQCSV